jgi:diguanylate cyclase (GGDEF)-like protein
MTAAPSPAHEAGPEVLLKTALECYSSAILHIAELAAPHHDQLMRLRERLALEPTVEALEESREALGAELARYREKAALGSLDPDRSLAFLDALTGLANRREFDRQVAARIAAGKQFCLLLFDLDGFKAINDRLGHLTGDEILKQVGGRLVGQIRARDFVCRWGGDEFLVILECGLANAVSRSRQIAQTVSGRYRIGLDENHQRVEVRVSVGVAERLPDESCEQLFARADQQLYREKAARTA